MAGWWRRRRITRRLAGLFDPGEELVLVERLVLGGWWVTTDRALYVVKEPDPPRRIPFGEIRAVQSGLGRLTATVRTTTDDLVNVAIRRRSAVLDQLLRLRPPPEDAHQ